MRLPILPFLMFLTVCVMVDTYIYFVALRRSSRSIWSKVQLISSLVMYVLLAVTVFLPRRSSGDDMLRFITWSLFCFMSVYASKALFVIFDLIASAVRLFGRNRVRIVTYVGAGVAVMLFCGMWWGALINRFRIDVVECRVDVTGLPAAFDGYRIVQISDLHVGTYMSDTTFIHDIVAQVNALHPDVILFTGDIVNRRSDELESHWRTLSRLNAPDGVYAILGNHDYGDYSEWPNEAMKGDNMCALYDYFGLMGWNLLLNDHSIITRGNDSIVLIGVENVGDPPFPVYGSLKDSYPDLSDDRIKILMTHNPAHWEMEVADNDTIDVALTLSGHTHAMQVRMLGLSPAAWRYEHWGGLYRDERGKSQLYVNIGTGTVGLPMRLGATPEITVITLGREQ